MKKLIFLSVFIISNYVFSSGGYDNGSPARKYNLDLEITINPANYIENGQSYVVWGYGLTNRLDFHGYFSHTKDINQIYLGFMYNFFSNKYLDLSTATGVRFIHNRKDAFLPQLLYTIKLPKRFDIIGSFVNVVTKEKKTSGVTYDIAVRAPVKFLEKIIPKVKQVKFALGAFKGVSNKWYPTYSLDFRF